MIITIDGPAGAGKSSAARRLAARLGFLFLDTGALYRAVTLAAVRAGVDLTDRRELAQFAAGLDIELSSDRVLLNQEDVTSAIRTVEITSLTRHAADNVAVRKQLTDLQQAIAAGRNVVTEGRDQATVAFPHAECKIFLVASEAERAKRRFRDLQTRGEQVAYEEVLRQQHDRDEQDVRRTYGGLIKAPDSIEVRTDGMTPEEVVEELQRIVDERRGSRSN